MTHTPPPSPLIVGGGAKKVLYTLKTLSRIGLKQSAKALTSRNTCKACGLGMGGQRGGMTNEMGEFPSVCNKSIQAQSTDIQPPIPEALFAHSLQDFNQLSAQELEHLGRLNTPLYKAAHAQHYTPLDWPSAIAKLQNAFARTAPERSFFYASGRSSNEAGFLLQLLARLYGSHNVNNCSYYCHQATGVGLNAVLGTGTATVSLEGLQHSDCIFVIGANPASNHPRFIHQLLRCRERGGQVIIINPAKEPGLVRFAVPKSAKSMLQGGSDIASLYLQPRIGTDAWVLAGLAKALLEQHLTHTPFIEQHTQNAADFFQQVSALPWDTIEQACGLSVSSLQALAQAYGRSQKTVFAWGMGITHHRNGVNTVELIANIALMRGMVGQVGAGLLPLRGHSNVQGMGTVGVKPTLSAPQLQALEAALGVNFPPAPKGLDTLACLEAAYEHRMDAALLMGGNLYAATPNAAWAQEALNRIGFKAYLTTTLNKGHFNGMDTSEALILPVAARDEEPQPTTQESMFNFVRLSDGGIHRLDGVKSEVAILADFAQGLLPHTGIAFHQWHQHNHVRQLMAQTIAGLAPLAQIHHTQQEFTLPNRLLETPAFFMPQQQARFAPFNPTPSPSTAEYPFILASLRSEGQFNSIIYEEADSYRGVHSRNSLLMNREDMQQLGLNPGDAVDVVSATAEWCQLSAQPFDLPQGNLLAYYPEANVLIGLDQDPRSKTPAFKSVAVRLRVV